MSFLTKSFSPISSVFTTSLPTVSSRSSRFISKTFINLSTTRTMAAKADSTTISQITEKEKEITGSDQPVKGGPTAQAQKHAGQDLDGNVISDITKGEKEITGGERVKGGPTSTAQSILTKVSN